MRVAPHISWICVAGSNDEKYLVRPFSDLETTITLLE